MCVSHFQLSKHALLQVTAPQSTTVTIDLDSVFLLQVRISQTIPHFKRYNIIFIYFFHQQDQGVVVITALLPLVRRTKTASRFLAGVAVEPSSVSSRFVEKRALLLGIADLEMAAVLTGTAQCRRPSCQFLFTMVH